MDNLRKFSTESEYTAATLNYPAVSWVTGTNEVHFDASAPAPTPSYKWIATYEAGEGETTTESADCSYNVVAINEEECTGDDIESVIIGACVTKIDYFAVYGGNINSVTVNAEVPPEIDDEGTNFNCEDEATYPIYVPSGSVSAYLSAENWSFYSSRIQAMPEPNDFQGKWLITYTGGTTDSDECPTGVFIKEGEVTKFTEYLLNVSIGACVEEIGENSFEGEELLSSVTFESGSQLTTIGNGSFQGIDAMTSIIIPSSVVSIGDRAFFNDMGHSEHSLSSVTFEAGSQLTSIGVSAFKNCYALESIDIPSGVTSIGSSAFQNCTSLVSVTINATTPPTLDEYAFDNTNDCPIYVPAASVTAYQTAWSNLASRIQAIQ